jgi:DNA ligase-4
LKETKFSKELEGILGLSGLSRWDGVVYEGEAGTGCLGREVETMMRPRVSHLLPHNSWTDDQLPKGQKSCLTISDLDAILDQLAAFSPFSQLSQPSPSTMTQSSLLTRLFRDSGLSPYALAVLTQIILRDLRPLLNPLPKLTTRNPTAMLRLKSNAGPAQLELYQAMRCWDPRMGKLYSTGKGDLDWCADTMDGTRDGGVAGISHGPIVGVNVQVGHLSREVVDVRFLNVGKVDHATMLLKHSQTLDHPVVKYGQRRNTMDTGTFTIPSKLIVGCRYTSRLQRMVR